MFLNREEKRALSVERKEGGRFSREFTKYH